MLQRLAVSPITANGVPAKNSGKDQNKETNWRILASAAGISAPILCVAPKQGQKNAQGRGNTKKRAL
jgi:hypothetical protein